MAEFFEDLDKVLDGPLLNDFDPVGIILGWNYYAHLQKAYTQGLFKPDRCETMGTEGAPSPWSRIVSYRGLRITAVIARDWLLGFSDNKGKVVVQSNEEDKAILQQEIADALFEKDTKIVAMTMIPKNPSVN